MMINGLDINWHPVISEHIIVDNGESERLMYIKDAIAFTESEEAKSFPIFCDAIIEFAKKVNYL